MLEGSLLRLKERIPDMPITGVLLSRLLLHLSRHIAGLWALQIRPFDLAETEFRVLTTLFSQPNGVAHPSDLCASAFISPANMSRISDALVSRGLITRVLSESDRRRLVLRITDQGEELVRHLLPILCGPLREMFKDFSDTGQHQLIAQLKLVSLKFMTQASPAPVV
jgi:MarR family transcriptional regulator, negative regulator of the multidrug operon emrRAB